MSDSTSVPWALNYDGLSNPNGLRTYLDQVSQLHGLLDQSGQAIRAAPAAAPPASIWDWHNPVGTSSLAPPPPVAVSAEEAASYSPDYIPGMTVPGTPQEHILRAAAEGARSGFGDVPGWQDIVYRPATTVIEAPFKLGGAVFGAGQGALYQGARELGAPETLARDIAALPESLGPDAPHLARDAPSALTPLARGVTDVLSDTRGGGPNPLKMYHGTPHLFPPTETNPLGAFDLSKIGTGEGAQVYGHGAYGAEDEAIARHYRDALTPLPVPTLDFSEVGGPKGLDVTQARESAHDFMMEHPDLDHLDEAPIRVGSGFAVDEFFAGRGVGDAAANAREVADRHSLDPDDLEQVARKTYDWLGDAKLDPGGPKVGDEPFNESNDQHKAAWYLHQAGGDHLGAIDQLDTELFNMQAMQKGGTNRFGPIAPGFYDQAIARVMRLKDIIDNDQGSEALPKYSEPDRGHMYEAEITAHPEHLLHWDKPLSQQSDYVRQRLSDLGYAIPDPAASAPTWEQGYNGSHELWRQDGPAGQLLASILPGENGAYHVYSPQGQYLGGSMQLDVAKRIGLELHHPVPFKEPTGEEIYRDLSKRHGRPWQPSDGSGGWSWVGDHGPVPDAARASEVLREAGIPALRYFDANSRREGVSLPDRIRDSQADVARHSADLINLEAKREALPRGSPEWAQNEIDIMNTDHARNLANQQLQRHRAAVNKLKHNFVIFDPSTVNIIRRYGLAGVMGGGAAAAAGGRPQSD